MFDWPSELRGSAVSEYFAAGHEVRGKKERLRRRFLGRPTNYTTERYLCGETLSQRVLFSVLYPALETRCLGGAESTFFIRIYDIWPLQR